MNREQMIEKAARAVRSMRRHGWDDPEGVNAARAVLDAILPQVTTEAELAGLPLGSKLLDGKGEVWRIYRRYFGAQQVGVRSMNGLAGSFADVLRERGPLTVVWTP